MVTQYAYNADGARVKRAAGSTTTYYVGNWYEVTQAGTVTKYYYFGGKRVAMRTSAGVTYLHADHLGSTSVASSASGALVARQTYFPYGAPRTSDGTLPTDYTFTGQRADASAGLMYYGARYYDAGLGRFISADTLVADWYNPQLLNRYAYVRNNPVNLTDPTGHCDPDYCRWRREENGGWVIEPKPPKQPPELRQPWPDSIEPAPESPVYHIPPEGKIISFTVFQFGVGNLGDMLSFDFVFAADGRVWLYRTDLVTGMPLGIVDGWMSPQGSGSIQIGAISGLESPGDYMGYARAKGASALFVTGEQTINQDENIRAGMFGLDWGVPRASCWDFATYSTPLFEIWPYPRRIR